MIFNQFWVPFWVQSGTIFVHFSLDVLVDFRGVFFYNFLLIWASILAPFWPPKSIPGALGREKVDP